jgi:hypothetical protein
MPSLAREIRKSLERVVKDARRVAEGGARKALKTLAVEEPEPPLGLNPHQRLLRNRLRAHGRQLGDRRDDAKRTQAIDRLLTECAYEHWHRLLFARFLAECNLLIEPETGVAISLDECRELAMERGTEWLPLASGFAERMLPQIFRAGDPVLDVTLPPETREELEELLRSLPIEVFVADDSLGWVYQFWQAERKDQVNESGLKIGADELAAVTQLFTEDYMVLFLLHNTLGAWWSSKRRAASKDASLPGYEWTYLRLNPDGTPAAGTFEDWPRAAKDLRILDPCMGSGHFLVSALPILVRFRMEEEGLSPEEAVGAVLRDNLFGLELDLRCTQIAAFYLALTAWRMVGYRPLPFLNLACSGLGINAEEEDWLRLTGSDSRLQAAMRQLYHVFQQAPILGSLIDPKRVGGDLFVAQFAEVKPVLRRALAAQQADEGVTELAVAARGLAEAAAILAGPFTLVTTNVPYLGRGKQMEVLREYCERSYPDAAADLATCFVERCIGFCSQGGSVALVTPQSWLFLNAYKSLRKRLLLQESWLFLARLGARAFETIGGEVVNVSLVGMTRHQAAVEHLLFALDVSEQSEVDGKRRKLSAEPAQSLRQSAQLKNPDSRIGWEETAGAHLLTEYASTGTGMQTFDLPRFLLKHWETRANPDVWLPSQSTVEATTTLGGVSDVVRWEHGRGSLFRYMEDLAQQGYHSGIWRAGSQFWGKRGVLVSLMGELPCTVYLGTPFNQNAGVLVPKDDRNFLAIWCFCESGEMSRLVRRVDQSLKVTNGSVAKIPFDLAHWQRIAAEKYPDGLRTLQCTDVTQWMFSGHPKESEHSLQVAVARLVGYRWPRQTGLSVADCSPLEPDGLEGHADDDGIVCLASLKGKAPAADRLRVLLAEAFGTGWSPAKQATLLGEAGHPGESLEQWLAEAFFKEHCDLFQQRPFVWHVWDGLKSGFNVLLNYHRLAAPNGSGRRTLEKLIFSYLGDWIDRQRADLKANLEGADARVAAAVHLKTQLERLLEGEPPFDLFARWKPLHEQPIEWDPDLDDGVRVNIRPFLAARPLSARGKSACILRVRPNVKWEKDRGKEPKRPRPDFPWLWSWDEQADDFRGGSEFDGNRWNDLHYTRAFKQAARDRHSSQEAETR